MKLSYFFLIVAAIVLMLVSVSWFYIIEDYLFYSVFFFNLQNVADAARGNNGNKGTRTPGRPATFKPRPGAASAKRTNRPKVKTTAAPAAAPAAAAAAAAY